MEAKAETERKFEHKVSKGSRFNQIYVPKEMGEIFEAGDIVEVKLIRKKEELHYSDNLSGKEVGKFKEGIIRSIFSYLETFDGVKQAFVVGSFLTQNTDYNDVDVLLITDDKFMEEKVYIYLTQKIQLKFHVIAIPEARFARLLEICPMTRSMLYYFVSNKKFKLPVKYEKESAHLKFLLMMPEDLLNLEISGGRIYFDAVRRLIAIKRFVERMPIDPIAIDSELKRTLSAAVYDLLKRNENLSSKILDNVKNIIRKELLGIRRAL